MSMKSEAPAFGVELHPLKIHSSNSTRTAA